MSIQDGAAEFTDRTEVFVGLWKLWHYLLHLSKMLLVDKYRPQSLKKMDYHTELSESLQSLVRHRKLC